MFQAKSVIVVKKKNVSSDSDVLKKSSSTPSPVTDVRKQTTSEGLLPTSKVTSGVKKDEVNAGKESSSKGHATDSLRE